MSSKMYRYTPRPSRAAGFSLLELTVTLVILGVVGVLLARWIGMVAEDRQQGTRRDLLQRADDAITAFAAARSRLPCPASNPDGLEDCSLQVGWLPYRTVGLPDARAGHLRYGVYRRAAGTADADLAQVPDRNRPLQVLASVPGAILGGTDALQTCALLATTGTSCAASPQLHYNGLDLCTGLRNAMHSSLDPGRVHTLHARGSTIAGHVAYALASSQPGQAAPLHRGGSVAFHSPREPSSPGYSDQVLAVGLDQLWTRLHCGDALNAASFAHANAVAAAALNVPAMADYQEQLEIMVDLSEAARLSGIAGILASVAQTAYAVGGVFDTVGETLDTYGAWNWRINLSIVGVGTAVGSVVAAAVAAGLADSYKSEAVSISNDFRNTFPAKARVLANGLNTELYRADMLGLYPDEEALRIARGFRAPDAF